MKVAIVGKGGSGKTTTAAVLARALARRGHEVVALDCDTNPNLGISLGIGEEATEELVGMRQALDEGTGEHASGWADLLDRFGSSAPDGVSFAVVSRIDNPEPGCPCCGLSPEQLLASVDDDRLVIADLEAGIGTLMRLAEGVVDATVVVVEPSPKSIEVGLRGVELATARSTGRLLVVGNRVRDEDDEQMIRGAFPAADVVLVPEDRSVIEADRSGRSPVDMVPQGPAVAALDAVTRWLVPVPA